MVADISMCRAVHVLWFYDHAMNAAVSRLEYQVENLSCAHFILLIQFCMSWLHLLSQLAARHVWPDKSVEEDVEALQEQAEMRPILGCTHMS